DVDTLHRRDGAQPPGTAAGTEPDDQRPPRLRMPDRAEQAEHHLGAGVGSCAPVGLAVDDEGVAVLLGDQRHAAFDTVAVPDDSTAFGLLPRAELVRRGEDVARRAAGADAAVTPDGCRPG